ncbi:MAG TPA: folylpolyglutamate synthase/dihydrofolate synthase family protein [Salinimicrobium sp.]|nr:folylpolyglutamate synthase/dihydrofolate synthase family protein [Salinimicrobium sp.]
MTYQETVAWMFQQLPMYQQIGNKAYRTDLSNVIKLCVHLGAPHEKFKTIHVAGTNGKGSVSHMLASILQEVGFKVGLYTSPHLKDFRERIRINTEMINEQAVVAFIDQNKTFLERENLSFFEMSVGMAFHYFSQQKVDIAVIEVGLGGRLDSTNIIRPEMSVITNIGYDHTQILGDTLSKIAREKAGIIKKNVPVVIGEFHPETYPVFKEISENLQAPIFLAEEFPSEKYESDLKGAYQQKNIATVIKSIEVLKTLEVDISKEAVIAGIASVVKNTALRGRWEILQLEPKIICDTAHNAEGLKYTMQQLQKEDFEKMHIVFGVVNDKDLSKIFPLLPKDATYYFCRPEIPRGLDAEKLKEGADGFHLNGNTYSSVPAAFEAAVKNAGKQDIIYVGGSTFTVAEII